MTLSATSDAPQRTWRRFKFPGSLYRYFGLLFALVFIGFSIDAITDSANRSLLIQNAAAFTSQPSLVMTMSDDAMQTGTSDTIYFEVVDAGTGAPINNALVSLSGCGVEETKLPELAAAAAQQWTATFNPREVDQQSLCELYRQAF